MTMKAHELTTPEVGSRYCATCRALFSVAKGWHTPTDDQRKVSDDCAVALGEVRAAVAADTQAKARLKLNVMQDVALRKTAEAIAGAAGIPPMAGFMVLAYPEPAQTAMFSFFMAEMPPQQQLNLVEMMFSQLRHAETKIKAGLDARRQAGQAAGASLDEAMEVARGASGASAGTNGNQGEPS